MERVHDSGEAVELSLVPLWLVLCDLGIERVQVQPDVNARIGESLHTVIVILGGVYVIHAYRIGPNLFHEGRIEAALSVVDERVIGNKLVRDAYTVVSPQPPN
jgi:hypothetical protein